MNSFNSQTPMSRPQLERYAVVTSFILGSFKRSEPNFINDSTSFVKSPIVHTSRVLISLSAVKPPIVKKKRKKRSTWSREEDVLLRKILEDSGVPPNGKNSPISWSDVATQHDSGRTAQQCRDRWNNYLRPGIMKGSWTKEEEELIKDMYKTIGPKWSVMAKFFKHRSGSSIKNKWYSMKRSEKRQEVGGITPADIVVSEQSRSSHSPILIGSEFVPRDWGCSPYEIDDADLTVLLV